MTAREAEQRITDHGGESEPSEEDYEDPKSKFYVPRH